MSKRGRTFVEILRQLGARIRKCDEDQIIEEKKQDPFATTASIVIKLDLAPQDLVDRAHAQARTEHSPSVIEDYFREARARMRDTTNAATALSRGALAIAAKK